MIEAARARRAFDRVLVDGGSRAVKVLRPSESAEEGGAPRREPEGKALPYAGARSLAIRLIHLKAQSSPEILRVSSTEKIMGIAAGLKAAFIARGFAIDAPCAQGIADAIQELVPGARDLIALPS